jgi:hypothetical protein
MPQTENGLDTEVIAQSCCMAFRAAQGLPRIPFEQVADEDEARWQRLALKAEEMMTSMEGMAFHQVGPTVAKTWMRESETPKLTPSEFWAWQAVTRHLAMLLEADEIPDNLQAREESWKEWVLNRLPKENV